MDGFLKILFFALTGCAGALILGRSEFRLAVSAVCACLCIGVIAVLLQPILSLAMELSALGGINRAIFAPLGKAAAIAVTAQLGGAFCMDAGERTIAAALEFGGVIAILYVSLPLFYALLDIIRAMIGG